MIKLEARKENGNVIISESSFEHLLACLANQKFIGEAPPNGDAMDMEPSDYRKVHKDMQSTIDDAWLQGMDLLYQKP